MEELKPSKDNSFCFYPFYAMVFKSWKKGSNDLKAVAPCCMMHDTWKPNIDQVNSVLSKEELEGLNPYEIFYHEKFKELRKNLINNVRDSNCATCWKQEEKGTKAMII